MVDSAPSRGGRAGRQAEGRRPARSAGRLSPLLARTSEQGQSSRVSGKDDGLVRAGKVRLSRASERVIASYGREEWSPRASDKHDRPVRARTRLVPCETTTVITPYETIATPCGTLRQPAGPAGAATAAPGR